MSEAFMLLGFVLAAYSIIANDSIQTLGTFLSSNTKRPWWMLWLWISAILVVTVLWGWQANGGDPAFGRLVGKGINFPGAFNVLYVIPPLVLVLLTRGGIPVSTSLLVLTAFASLTALEGGADPKSAGDVFLNMIKKSVVGYLIAFGIGVGSYLMISGLEKKFRNDEAGRDNPKPAWFVFQWLSTGFLWSMWLVQDLANVFVYLPRKLDLWAIVAALAGMVILLGFLIRNRGGKIQQVITEKTNTVDLRSATFIDFLYGLVLLFFKVDYIPKIFAAMNWAIPWPQKMPMSTTWVFLGLLAGRELGMWIRLRDTKSKELGGMVLRDLAKVSFGAAISLLVAFGVPYVAISSGMIKQGQPAAEQVEEANPAEVIPATGDAPDAGDASADAASPDATQPAE